MDPSVLPSGYEAKPVTAHPFGRLVRTEQGEEADRGREWKGKRVRVDEEEGRVPNEVTLFQPSIQLSLVIVLLTEFKLSSSIERLLDVMSAIPIEHFKCSDE